MTDNNLTVWIRHGLIRPHGERSGRGNARRYPFYEANIAAILLHLHRFNASIETMKGIAGIYRDALAWGLSFGYSPDQMHIFLVMLHEPIFQYALKRERTGEFDEIAFSRAIRTHIINSEIEAGIDQSSPEEAQAAIAAAGNDERLVGKPLIDFAKSVGVDDWEQHASAFADLLSQPRAQSLPCPVFFWKTESGWRRGESIEGQLIASNRDGAFVTIAVDMLGVFFRLWNKGEESGGASGSHAELQVP
ncbi:hypothetical protein [Sphingomonas dokdonensis]|uniref:Uncharacterized protein n=1 Tax=Sphingomonas dokdonensis TaxID=344880 RepID=A0A245ZNJ1_9SPHN|nr:hypothetical protein [Sphingomonas dokdonensis]OWK31310.1 hypothetical protein SPDO_13170 [Sphingomonas dokdonensis]